MSATTEFKHATAPTSGGGTAAPDLTLDAKGEETMNLLTRGLQEVLGEDIIRAKLKAGERLIAYWGTAPTGKPHLGYFVPFVKIADFLSAGVEVKILLADLHACLDNGKSTLDIVVHRVAYYSKLLHAVFTSLGVPTDRLKFVTGTEYQLKADYTFDMYKLATLASLRDAIHAGAEVVKQVESPQLSSLLYPGLQALDEQYLGVDFQFGGVDQRKIFIMAEKFLPRLGYKRRAHLMNPMVPGLAGGKMSSSDPNSKIDFLDDAATVKKKISKAFCEKGNITENGLLSFMKAVIFPIQSLRRDQMRERGEDPDSEDNKKAIGVPVDCASGTLFCIDRPEKYGGRISFITYQEMEDAFASGDLGPPDLKMCVTDQINALLEPIRKVFESDEEFAKVRAAAYPEEQPAAKPEKKTKEKKDKQQKKQEGAQVNGTETGANLKNGSKAAAADAGDASDAVPEAAASIMADGVDNLKISS